MPEQPPAPREKLRDRFHHLRSKVLGSTAVEAEASQNKLNISVPDKLLSADEMNDWAKQHGFGHGKRGTYHTDNHEAYTYIKHCLSVTSEADVAPSLAFVRHLTAAGILHPDTQWGAFKRSDTDFQLFPVSPGLTAVTLEDIYEQPDKFASFNTPANQEGSHLLEWCRRIDPDYAPTTSYLWEETAPPESLIRALNTYEASHSNNWGYDEHGTFYPVDVEVIALNSNLDTVRSWYAAEQARATS